MARPIIAAAMTTLTDMRISPWDGPWLTGVEGLGIEDVSVADEIEANCAWMVEGASI